MDQRHTTLRKVLWYGLAAAAGAVGGLFLAQAAIQYFAGSAFWVLPATLVGGVGCVIVAALVVAPALANRNRARD
jgi:hypothetical protein